MSNILRDTLAKIDLPVTQDFMTNVAAGFATSAVSLLSTKYIVQMYDKSLVTHPLIAVVAGAPSFFWD